MIMVVLRLEETERMGLRVMVVRVVVKMGMVEDAEAVVDVADVGEEEEDLEAEEVVEGEVVAEGEGVVEGAEVVEGEEDVGEGEAVVVGVVEEVVGEGLEAVVAKNVLKCHKA